MSDKPPRIPTALARYFADSDIALVSWTGSQLTLKITKDIGPEEGLLVFSDVSHVNLPPGLTVESIRAAETNELPADFFERFRPGDRRLDPDEAVFFILGSWGGEYFVIASRLSYSILS
jgi:hypothetical protein